MSTRRKQSYVPRKDFNDVMLESLDELDEHKGEIEPGMWKSVFDRIFERKINGEILRDEYIEVKKKQSRGFFRWFSSTESI